MIIGALPLVLQIALNDTHGNDRDAIESDIADHLYSRFVYIVTSVSFILPIFKPQNYKIITRNILNFYVDFLWYSSVSFDLGCLFCTSVCYVSSLSIFK